MSSLYLHNKYWYDIVFSPDDGGWYAQRHEDDATSNIYSNVKLLLLAFERGEVEKQIGPVVHNITYNKE